MKAALGLLITGLLICSQTYNSAAEPRKITPAEKKYCAAAYHKFCGEYGLETAALRNCMDRNGRSLSHACIEALIEAGEVSRSEVERRRKSSR
jgi:hypothetical protein